MRDPIRLREGGSSFEASLLDSARDDKAGDHLEAAVHATLGLGAAVVVATTTSTAAAAGAATGAATKGAGTALGLAVAKWSLAIVVAGAVVGKTAEYVRAPRRVPVAHAAAAREAPPLARPASPGSEVRPPTSVAAPTVPEEVDRGAPPAMPAQLSGERSVGPAPLDTTAPPPAPSSLKAELSPIDAARAAIDSGNDALALELLNRHDLDFPHGQLGPEALALRVEVYASRHDDSKVRELTERFLTQYPDHPESARVRSMAQRRPTP